ncbi:MAG: pyridoxal phosphate-dependent aminotransferase [Alcanivoracaceae bacterium]|nr:pyridoxal phosphate-dependent aminotransferase [Alcanivoracaceae bacterium]
MNNNFPKLAMAKFSEQYKGQKLISMHATNPEPFSQAELEQTIGQSFESILKNVNLGFAADEGTLALRQTLATNLYDGIFADDVITHAGAQEVLFCAFHALLHPGDKVLAVAPIFEPLVQIPLNIGCGVSYVHLDSNNDWSLNLDDVEKQFSSGCRLFVINFPHNPTGATLSGVELQNIINLCRKYDVWLLSDEVFRGLEHDLTYRLPAVAAIYQKGISVGVISKAYAVPGIRVGWLVCQDKQLRDRVLDIKGYLSICNSQIDEKLASEILKAPEKLLNRNLKIIIENKRLLKDIQSISGVDIDIIIPEVGCCVFTIINPGQITSTDLVKKIAKHSNYLLYPSDLFKTDVNALRIGFGGKKFNEFVHMYKT